MTLEALRPRSPLLDGLAEESMGFLESVSEETTVEPNTILFAEDGVADEFFLIVAGTVGLEVTRPAGPPLRIETLGRGEMLGLSWLSPPYRWSWNARAIDRVTLIRFDAGAVRARLDDDPDLGAHVYRAVAEEALRRLHATRLRLLDLYPGGDP